MEQNLESLCGLLQDSSYLLGDEPSLADFAVAGLTMYVKFPAGGYLSLPEDLKGLGVPGLADNPAYALFWAWRDRIYTTFRKVGIPTEPASTPGSRPTSINIE
jgi:glutathione S-transferase